MLFINKIHTDIIFFFPFKLSTHKISFCWPESWTDLSGSRSFLFFSLLTLVASFTSLLLGSVCIFLICPRLSVKESVWPRTLRVLLISIICPLPLAGYGERTAVFKPLWEIIAFQVLNYKCSLFRFRLLKLLLRRSLKRSIIFCKSEDGRIEDEKESAVF